MSLGLRPKRWSIEGDFKPINFLKAELNLIRNGKGRIMNVLVNLKEV